MADSHIHELRVRGHVISCEDNALVQNGMGHDALTLDLDATWDGLSPVIVLGPCESAVTLLWSGEPVTVPAALIEETGWLPVSVVGYGSDGSERVTTERCARLLKVVPSGCVCTEPVPDAPDVLGQLVEAADKANDAAKSATESASSASEAASLASSAAKKASDAADRADKSATGADEAAARADQAAVAAGEKSVEVFADPDASDRVIVRYPSFLVSSDGGSIYMNASKEEPNA